LSIPEHNLKSIQDMSTKLPTHIKQVAFMCVSLLLRDVNCTTIPATLVVSG